jgi:mRNA-decapping enzyme subunit 2
MDAKQTVDLVSRFIVNLPGVEFESWNRIWYHLELAYYFWIDHMNGNTSSMTIEQFGYELMRTVLKDECPSLRLLSLLYSRFVRVYKYCIPVCGIALTCNTKALLVQNKSSGKWGFTKGKINCGESAWECAVRELKEESDISYDAMSSHVVSTKKHTICLRTSASSSIASNASSSSLAGSRSRGAALRGWGNSATAVTLYHVKTNDSSILQIKLKPHCPQEIVDCRWFEIDEIKNMKLVSALTRRFFAKIPFPAEGINCS